MTESKNWSHGDEKIDSIFEERLFHFGKSVEHLGCSLRMTDVGELLLSSNVSHIVDLSGQVVIAEILEVEVVEFLAVFVSIILIVFSGMHVSSVVSKPHIVAISCELECWGGISIVS